MNIAHYSTKYYDTTANKSVNNYLADIRKAKVMSAAEEKACFERIANGDAKAKEEIIIANQRFVYSLAKIYSKDEDEVLDYVNEGNIGLIEAIDKFDYTLGYKFITFAVNYIRREMNYYLTTENGLIAKSNAMKIGKKADRIRQAYSAEHGFAPTNEEVMELLKEKYNIVIKDVSDIYDLNVSSINAEIDDDYTMEDNTEFNEITASINLYENDVNSTYNNMLVNNILEGLSDKQKDVIKMFYGIGMERAYTLEEIGLKYNMDAEMMGTFKNTIIKYLKENRSEIKIAI